jgi:hypothetical protein
LADGSALSADLLVVACGVRPETALAERAGLRVDRGVVVDDRLRPPGRVMLIYTMPPPAVAADAAGRVYASWHDARYGDPDVFLSRSTDGGRHWSTPTVVSHHDSAQSFNHAVTVTNDGELAVLYYDDYRNNSKPGIPTDVYLRHSADGGTTWSAPQRLASFDLANAPIARGYFVGDYQGLAPIGARGLLAFFGVTGNTRESANVLSVRLNR